MALFHVRYIALLDASPTQVSADVAMLSAKLGGHLSSHMGDPAPQALWFARANPIETLYATLRGLKLNRPDALTVLEVPTRGYLPIPAPTRPRAYIGVDCNVKDIEVTRAQFPGMRYMRDFGSPILLSTPEATRVKAGRDMGLVIHYSCKTLMTELQVDAWMDRQTQPFMFTYYHEPMGNIEPELCVRNAAIMVDVMRKHPNGKNLIANGPILTRYWLATNPAGPAQWLYPHADTLFVDTYVGSWNGNSPYPPPGWMFGQAASLADALKLQVGFPEWGAERQPSDPTGEERARYIRDCGAYLKTIPSLVGVGWWNIGGCSIVKGSPEEQALRELM